MPKSSLPVKYMLNLKRPFLNISTAPESLSLPSRHIQYDSFLRYILAFYPDWRKWAVQGCCDSQRQIYALRLMHIMHIMTWLCMTDIVETTKIKKSTPEFPLFFHLLFVQNFSPWCPETFCHEERWDCSFFQNAHRWDREPCLDSPFATEDAHRYQNSSCQEHRLRSIPTRASQHPPLAPTSCASAPFPICLVAHQWKQWGAAREGSVGLTVSGGVQRDCSNTQSNLGNLGWKEKPLPGKVVGLLELLAAAY